MDDESKQLLREMRDSTLRHEKSQKRLTLIVLMAVGLILAVLAFLTVRLEIRMRAVERTEQDAEKSSAPTDPDPS